MSICTCTVGAVLDHSDPSYGSLDLGSAWTGGSSTRYANVLATFSTDDRLKGLRATAGGLDILFWLQDRPESLSGQETADPRLIATALNRMPFLGQPTNP